MKKRIKKAPYMEWDLSNYQRSVLIGTVLGDSTLKIDKKSHEANFSFSHSPSQKELGDTKAEIFSEIKSSYYLKIPPPHKKTGKVYPCWCFSSRQHPVLTHYYKMFYVNGVKSINDEILDLFDEISLSYLFMDDGSRTTSGYVISTQSFREEEIDLLRNKMLEMGLETTRTKQKLIYIRASSRKSFIDMVSPYMLDSLRYKL